MKKIIAIAAIITASATAAEYDWFSALDKNADGMVTPEEWLSARTDDAKKNRTAFDAEKSMQFFKTRDVNGDGHISREELMTVPRKKTVPTVGLKIENGSDREYYTVPS